MWEAAENSSGEHWTVSENLWQLIWYFRSTIQLCVLRNIISLINKCLFLKDFPTLGQYFDPADDCSEIARKKIDAKDGFFWIKSFGSEKAAKVSVSSRKLYDHHFFNTKIFNFKYYIQRSGVISLLMVVDSC